VVLALGGLPSGVVGSDPARELEGRVSNGCVNRTRLLRLNEEGAYNDPEVADD
jgi:hypothetical protein